MIQILNIEYFFSRGWKNGNKHALDALRTIPLVDYAHEILLENFHFYLITGGIPEVVSQFLNTGNLGLLSGVFEDLSQSFALNSGRSISSNNNHPHVCLMLNHGCFIFELITYTIKKNKFLTLIKRNRT